MMLHRNNRHAGPPPWATPDSVPQEVTDVELWATLGAGRPDAIEGSRQAGSRGLGSTTASLEVEGIRCPLVHAGHGAPVLMIHGLGHDMWDWTDLFAMRPSHLAFSAIDLPGFGLADKPDRAYPLRLLSAAILTAAAEARARTGLAPLVIASSLGGHVAMLAALQSPDAFAGMVLVSPGGLVRVGFPTEVAARAYYSERAIVHRSDREIVANTLRIFQPQGGKERSPRALVLAARKLAIHRSSLCRTFARPFSRIVTDVFKHPVETSLHKIVPPTCVVFGLQDKVVPPAWCESAAPKIGAHGATSVPLAGLGHLPMVEDPTRFWRSISPFIERVHGASAGASRQSAPNETASQ